MNFCFAKSLETCTFWMHYNKGGVDTCPEDIWCARASRSLKEQGGPLHTWWLCALSLLRDWCKPEECILPLPSRGFRCCCKLLEHGRPHTMFILTLLAYSFSDIFMKTLVLRNSIACKNIIFCHQICSLARKQLSSLRCKTTHNSMLYHIFLCPLQDEGLSQRSNFSHILH